MIEVSLLETLVLSRKGKYLGTCATGGIFFLTIVKLLAQAEGDSSNNNRKTKKFHCIP